MPVFNLTATFRNGNVRSRPIVAVSAVQALEEWRGEIELEASGHLQGIVFEVTQAHDPDGSYETALRLAEIRRLEHEYYRHK